MADAPNLRPVLLNERQDLRAVMKPPLWEIGEFGMGLSGCHAQPLADTLP
jgi:hypothetical protein